MAEGIIMKIFIKVKDVKNPLADVDINQPGQQVLTDTKGKVLKVVTVCGEGKTEQSHKKECDINFVLRNYQKTGLITHVKKHEGRYDDISVQDFQQAMEIYAEGKNRFEELPSNIRMRFENDPAKFIDF